MSNRNAMLAKSAIAVKQLGLSDDDFRGVLHQQFGVSSRRDLSDQQLAELIDHFRSKGFEDSYRRRSGGNNRPAGKRPKEVSLMRALWISGWHLGVVRENSDKALASFAKRVTGGEKTPGQLGTDRLEWLDGTQTVKVIEALKDLLAREGGVDWAGMTNGVGCHYTAGKVSEPRVQVVAAQWRRMADLGVVRIRHLDAASQWALKIVGGPFRTLPGMTDDELDQVIREFGAIIRKKQKAMAAAASSAVLG
jgi:phage gp16-like protein